MSNTLGFGLDINRGGAVRFTPKAITGLALWLDASDIATITKDGSNYVSAWADKSGNGRNMAQATGSAQPLWSASGITFDGVNDFMLSTSFAMSQPVTYYLTLTVLSWTDADTFIDGYNMPPTNYMAVYQTGSTPQIRMYLTTGGSNYISKALNEASIMKICFNGANSNIQLNNGTVYNESFSGTPTITAGIILGARKDTDKFAHIKVSSVLVYNKVVTAEEDVRIKNYLSRKWGITI